MPVIDLTEQPDQGDIGPQRVPTWEMRSHLSMVQAAIGPKPEYHDTYRFTGKTFRERDILTHPNHGL